MEVANRRGLRVVEDASQAHGATYRGRRVGSIGDVGCFSLYPTKNLGGLGDGGIVVTRHAELGHTVRLLREYGWRERFVSERPGWNSRLDELQAAVLRVKLRRLDEFNETRRRIAERYDRQLSGLDLRLLRRQIDGGEVFHLYVVRSPRRDVTSC